MLQNSWNDSFPEAEWLISSICRVILSSFVLMLCSFYLSHSFSVSLSVGSIPSSQSIVVCYFLVLMNMRHLCEEFYSVNDSLWMPYVCLCVGTDPENIPLTWLRWRLFSTRPHRSFIKCTSLMTQMRWDMFIRTDFHMLMTH